MTWSTNMLHGLDVSYAQTRVDWASVGASRAFVFVKATEGLDVVDAMLSAHWSGARGRLARGPYHFFHPRDDAREQAAHFLDALAVAEANFGASELPCVVDFETLDGVAGAAAASGLETWLKVIADARGVKPIVYGPASILDALPERAWDADADLWVASWDCSTPIMPRGWSDWLIWQHDSHTVVPGIATPVDVDCARSAFWFDDGPPTERCPTTTA